MNTIWDADTLVKVRSKNVDRYKHNLLRQAVCEFRFPTLMELGDPRPPSSFVKALRKEYPNLELTNELMLGIGGASNGFNNTHVFRSTKLTWAVTLKQSAFSIETTAYTNYAQMKERILRVVEAASKIIDSDFFTRVGLRYINVISNETDPTDGWINSELVNPLRSGYFSGIKEYAGKLQLLASDGSCLLQHGLRLNQHPTKGSVPEYFLDIDTCRNEVALGDTEAALDAIHAQSFDIFDWAIGEKTREYLSAEKSSLKG